MTESTPEVALMTIAADSTASSTESERPRKSGNPGVSIRLSCVPLRVEAADRGVERMLQLLFLRIEIRNGGAALQAAFGTDRLGLQ